MSIDEVTRVPTIEERREAKDRCLAALKDAWTRCDHYARFEAWSELYYQRFHRLGPGKSEPAVLSRDSGDAENRAQCDAWHSTGLAAFDAIMEVVRLQDALSAAETRIEELTL